MLKALHKWNTIACQLKEIEPLVISGYRSEKQRITARTLEKTGTYEICDKNRKLDESTQIASHGFTVI